MVLGAIVRRQTLHFTTSASNCRFQYSSRRTNMGDKQPYFGLRGTKLNVAIAIVAGFDML